MPIGFLTEEQRRQYGHFVGEPTSEQLRCYWRTSERQSPDDYGAHIFAALMLDAETANCYFRGRGKAEAMLTYFSWKWRFLVMLGIVKVIFGPANSSPKPASTAERTRLFFDLLKAIPAKDRSFVLRASEPWPETAAGTLVGGCEATGRLGVEFGKKSPI